MEEVKKYKIIKFMKLPFNYQNIHACEAVVLTCIDFRFWRETVKFVEDELGIKSFDFPSLPGAAKAINDATDDADIAMRCIAVPCGLHHVKKIVIVNHQDCGAYGGGQAFNGDEVAELKFHEQELRKAKEKLAAKYPDKEIILAFAKLTDNGENIEFFVIK